MPGAALLRFGHEAQNAGSKEPETAEMEARGVSEALRPLVSANGQQTHPAMATIRVLSEDDVPAAAALFARVYPQLRWHSQTACESYFREMLFDNPWRDPELPSWVAEQDGRIFGMQAVMPRPMRFQGRTLRVAVSCQFMVDPDKRRSLTALQLIQAYLSGPQDLSLADGANDQARHLWVAIGGTAPLLYSLHWTRMLRPARYTLSLLEERGGIARPVSLAARPLCAIADALAAWLPPNRFLREDDNFSEDTLDPAAMLSHFPDVMCGASLQPVYDARSLAWLLEQAGRKTRHGKLRSRVVLGSKQRPIGWYLYYLNAGDVSEVVQIAALDGSFDQVLQRLLADAWKNGAAALRGRLEPRFVQELSDRHCWLRREGSWTLVHSRHADVTAAIQQGDAFLSRLEGEWWMRFVGEGETTHSVRHACVDPARSPLNVVARPDARLNTAVPAVKDQAR